MSCLVIITIWFRKAYEISPPQGFHQRKINSMSLAKIPQGKLKSHPPAFKHQLNYSFGYLPIKCHRENKLFPVIPRYQ